jgi:hypothetical protein
MSERRDPEDIPEVLEYIKAETELRGFITRHQRVFEEFSQHVAAVNNARSQADKVVRSEDVSCGPWDRYQVQVSYDARALYEAMGREGFLEVGGKLNTTTTYDVDKAKVKAAIARGDISKTVAEVVRKETPKYHAPKDIELP